MLSVHAFLGMEHMTLALQTLLFEPQVQYDVLNLIPVEANELLP